MTAGRSARLNIEADCAGQPARGRTCLRVEVRRDAHNGTPGRRQSRLRIHRLAALILRHSFEPRDNVRLAHLCGSLDEHLRSIESLLDVSVSRRNEFFRVEGPKPAAEHAMNLLLALYEQSQRPIGAEQLQLALVQIGAGGLAAEAAGSGSSNAAADGPTLRTRRVDLVGRTPNQLTYLRNILAHDITFGIGPAGTGKTFLAVACAVDALERSAVQRIILTRPAVEAGERLGFLPGDLAQKVDPYLRPLYDALYDLMGADKVARALEKGTLEIAPLAFMRGRTLNHAFVILDEAQNSTSRADEDVPDAHRLRHQGRDQRRREPDRSAARHRQRPDRRRARAAARARHRDDALHVVGCGAAPARGAHRRGVRRGALARCVRWVAGAGARRAAWARRADMAAVRPPLTLSLQFAEVSDRALLPRHKVARWIRAALERPGEITVRVVGAEEGQALNRAYRAKDYATNVLTFDYSREPVVSADLVLCAPVLQRESRELGIPLEAHYAHLLVHGTLHAQGHDHEVDAEARAMEARETALMRALGFADPYDRGR